jgi:electron transport complex protein RnfC
MLKEYLDRIFGFRGIRQPLNLTALPITEVPASSLLSLPLIGDGGAPLLPKVEKGDEVSPGQPLAEDGAGPGAVCPVKGKVAAVVAAPDARGARVGKAVLVEPSDESYAAFSGLDPEKESPEKLWERIREAGLVTDAVRPRPLAEVIGPKAGVPVDVLVVSAADREPEQLGRMAGASKTLLALPGPVAKDAAKVLKQKKVSVLSIPPFYPESLEPLVALRAGGGEGARVVSAETALAALDAVKKGRVQDRKVVTFIGPDGRAKANYRTPLGMRLVDFFDYIGLKPGEADKVLVGGPMRGFAQYSLEASIDAGVDAVTLVPSESIINWSDEPCVNSGGCVAVCPVNLQPQLIARYAEFGLFDRTEELGVMYCIDCGLCAAVCVGRRPLLQWIRLAKREVIKIKAAEKVRETEACQESADGGPEQVETAAEGK